MAGCGRVAVGGRRGGRNTRRGGHGRAQGAENLGFEANLGAAANLEGSAARGRPIEFGGGAGEFDGGASQFIGGADEFVAGDNGGIQSRGVCGPGGRPSGASSPLGSPGLNGNRAHRSGLGGRHSAAREDVGVDFANDIGGTTKGARARGRGATSISDGNRGATKGLNFTPEEERQLTRSVMAISQDPVTGNQQKHFSFWKRIHEHYDSLRPGGFRPSRSLESKWGHIKHDVSKFIGVYQQTLDLQVTGTSPTDTLRMAKELYRTKHVKHVDFTFEHCWVLVKDFPRWAEGWGTTKNATPSKRTAITSNEGSHEAPGECGSIAEGAVSAERNRTLRDRPGGTKATKEVHKAEKVAEGAMYKQAAASEVMAAAVMRKVGALEDHNLILLMTAPDASGVQSETAKEFMRLRHEEELKKLQKRLAAQDRKDLEDAVAQEEQERLRACVESARCATEDRENEETRRQMEERNPHLEDFEFHKEEDHYEDDSDFEENEQREFQSGDGFQDVDAGIEDQEGVIGETQETGMGTDIYWQPRTTLGLDSNCTPKMKWWYCPFD